MDSGGEGKKGGGEGVTCATGRKDISTFSSVDLESRSWVEGGRRSRKREIEKITEVESASEARKRRDIERDGQERGRESWREDRQTERE